MGFRFRKSFQIAFGVRVNIGKKERRHIGWCKGARAFPLTTTAVLPNQLASRHRAQLCLDQQNRRRTRSHKQETTGADIGGKSGTPSRQQAAIVSKSGRANQLKYCPLFSL